MFGLSIDCRGGGNWVVGGGVWDGCVGGYRWDTRDVARTRGVDTIDGAGFMVLFVGYVTPWTSVPSELVAY